MSLDAAQHSSAGGTRIPKLLKALDADESRTPEELYEHYLVERELADQLRYSKKEDRTTLYSEVYNELFRRVPRHPQLTRVARPEKMASIIEGKMRLLAPFLRPNSVFLEIGAGDCRLPIEVAKHVRQVYAVDVSDEVNKGISPPQNFQLILSNGTDIPVPPGTVDIAFSYQLMEHVHPDDAVEQLRSLYKALAPGGIYMCVTPNRLNGPHDISRYFDQNATGFHLKEYTIGELQSIFHHTGFSKVYAYPGGRGRHVRLPAAPVSAFEHLLEMLPWSARKSAAALPLIEHLLLSPVIAVKS